MRSIEELKNIQGKTILLRVDFNVPIKNGAVEDDFRIIKALPTIDFLLKKGAKIILITHLGKDGSANLEPVIAHFWKVSKFQGGHIEFFENVRKFSGEATNDPVFAKKLAALGDIYVNDAFPVSHRTHASLVGITQYLPSYAGFQLEREIKNLSRAFKNPKHPFLFILGGAKFSTKIPLLKKYLKLADYVFVGGALANDFLKARGYEIGKSLVDDTDYDIKQVLQNKKLILPIDVVVKTDTSSAMAKLVSVKKISEIQADDSILDIGSETVKNLASLIKKSKFILWNGPLGKYEDGGAEATKQVLKLVARGAAESIIGGGDTVALVTEMKMESKFSFVSTGGGATLEFLASKELPALTPLME